jgi:hypothetical protein
VSASQVILVLLIVAAFALGWWGRGRRAASPPSRPDDLDLDRALLMTLTAFQAALSLWQARGSGDSPSLNLARQSVDAFERRRLALAALALGPDALPEATGAYARAQRAAGRLADGLAPFADGARLDLQTERALVSAERTLVAARLELRGVTGCNADRGL